MVVRRGQGLRNDGAQRRLRLLTLRSQRRQPALRFRHDRRVHGSPRRFVDALCQLIEANMCVRVLHLAAQRALSRAPRVLATQQGIRKRHVGAGAPCFVNACVEARQPCVARALDRRVALEVGVELALRNHLARPVVNIAEQCPRRDAHQVNRA